MKKNFIYLLLFALVVLSACKKDEEPANTPTELLTLSTWKIISYVDVEGELDIDDPCERDNLWTFKSDNTLVVDEGATKCDDDSPQQITGLWALTTVAEVTTITITLYGPPVPLTVLELTDEVLKFTAGSSAEKVTVTMEH